MRVLSAAIAAFIILTATACGGRSTTGAGLVVPSRTRPSDIQTRAMDRSTADAVISPEISGVERALVRDALSGVRVRSDELSVQPLPQKR